MILAGKQFLNIEGMEKTKRRIIYYKILVRKMYGVH